MTQCSNNDGKSINTSKSRTNIHSTLQNLESKRDNPLLNDCILPESQDAGRDRVTFNLDNWDEQWESDPEEEELRKPRSQNEPHIKVISLSALTWESQEGQGKTHFSGKKLATGTHPAWKKNVKRKSSNDFELDTNNEREDLVSLEDSDRENFVEVLRNRNIKPGATKRKRRILDEKRSPVYNGSKLLHVNRNNNNSRRNIFSAEVSQANMMLDPSQIASDLLWEQSRKTLGMDFKHMMHHEESDKLFKDRISNMTTDQIGAIAVELFSNVKKSDEMMRVACSVNRENCDKQLTMETLIEKTHQMVDCKGVCLYLLDTKHRLIVGLTDEPSIFVDARLSLKTSLAGKCAISEKNVRRCANLEARHLPEFQDEEKLPSSVLFVPIHGADSEVMGVIGVFSSPKSIGFDENDESLITFVSSLAGYTLVNMLRFEKQTQKNLQVEYLMKTISRMESNMEHGPAGTITELLDLSYKLFHCQRIAFFEVDGDELICSVSRDFAEGRLPKDKGIIGYVVRTGETVNIPDAYKDPRFNREVDVKTKFQTKSILAAPVIDEFGEVMGVIQCINKRRPQGKFSDPLGIANTYNIMRKRGTARHSMPSPTLSCSTEGYLDLLERAKTDHMQDFTPAQVNAKSENYFNRQTQPRMSSFLTKEETVPFPVADELLIETLAKSAGVVIVKSRLFRKLVMAQRKNKALIHVLQVTSTDMELPEMLEEIASATCDIIRADRISIFLVDNEEKRLCSIVSKDKEMVNLCVPLGHGIIGNCFTNRKAVRVHNPYEDERFLTDIDKATGFVTKSLIAVPITDARDNNVGVLEALNKKDGTAFTNEDEELLLAISKEVGECIRRGLVMLDPKTRQVLLADDAQYPWQAAMMEIYSRNYFFGLPWAGTSVQGSGQISVSMSTMTADFEFGALNNKVNISPQEVAIEVAEMLDTAMFDALSYSNSELDDICFLIFAKSEVLEKFNLDKRNLRKFIVAVGQKYRDNPYHNYNHGVHVMQFVYYMLRNTSAHEYLRYIDILSVLISGLCHDIKHPGHTSDFEIQTDSKLSLRYNDVSVLENMHAYETFSLIRQPGINIFEGFTELERRELRKLIINAILATDMTHHRNFTKTLSEKDSAEAAFDREDPSSRQFVINTIVHSADISAQVYVWEVAKEWEERVTQEFLGQVEREKKEGLTPCLFMAEMGDSLKRYKSQIFFCDVILKPFWTNLARLFPKIESRVRQLEVNRSNYMDLVNKFKSPEEQKEELKEGVKVIKAPMRKKKKRKKPGLTHASSLDKLWDLTKRAVSPRGKNEHGLPRLTYIGEKSAISYVIPTRSQTSPVLGRNSNVRSQSGSQFSKRKADDLVTLEKVSQQP